MILVDPSHLSSEKNPIASQSKWSVDFIVPVVSVVLMFGAIIAIGIKMALGPS
jgi:hypothetical protein